MGYFYSIRELLIITILLLIIKLLNCENITFSRSQREVYFPGRYNNAKSHNSGCDTTITKKEGWIYSPNFPSNYDNSVVCNYRIVKYSDDVCSIEITFTDFDLEDTPQCTGDYLDLGDNSGRMCGVLISDTRKKLYFPTNKNSITITFHSDANNNRKGFMGQIIQLRNTCAHSYSKGISNFRPVSESRPNFVHERQPIYLGSYCDIFIGEVVGDLRSPGFPYGYANNHSCVYSIRRAASDICKVELIIHQLDISSNGRQCDTDYVELPDKSRLCGKVPFQKRVYRYSPSSDYLIIQFISDDYNERGMIGFWIEVKQVRHSCDHKTTQNALKCDQIINKQLTRIHSPNFPQFYGPSQQCVYLVEPLDQNTCEYELEFINFNVESSRDNVKLCQKDFLQLPDGSRGCGFETGKRTFHFPKYRDRIGMFYFASDDSIEDRGYEISVNQIPNSCSHTHSHDHNHNHGIIKSPSFSTPYSFQNPTHYSTTVSPFRSNNSLYNCDKIVTRDFDIITSPNYPRNYPLTTRCIYTILKSAFNVCKIKIEIINLDLEHTSGCSSDYLMIESTGERLCGSFDRSEQKLITFPKFSRELRLIFNSDRQTTRPGFQLKIEQIPNSCENSITNQRPNTPLPIGQTPIPQICGSSSAIVSTFQSDNYPLAYNSDTDCVYKVFRANRQVCRLEVYFDDFDVGVEDFTHKLCNNDYLEIDGMRYCGRRKGELFIVAFGHEKEEMTIRFHTDSTDRFGGFRIQVRQLDDNCRSTGQHDFSPGSTESCNKMTFSEKSLQILSPHYNSGSYRPFLDCEYIVRKSTFDVCALEVKFDAFSLEESRNCAKDYLQIGSMKLCGKLPYNAIRTYEFANDEITIKFHTDSNGSDAGFVILVKQIQC